MNSYKIIVTAVIDTSKLHLVDTQDTPSGVHYFDASSEDEALDEFHATVPIKVLDDFVINISRIN